MDPGLREERNKLMEMIIDRAKKKLEVFYRREKDTWLEASPPNSCADEDCIVKLFVLEDVPPNGYIIADYASGIVKGFGPSRNDLRYVFTIKAFNRDIKFRK